MKKTAFIFILFLLVVAAFSFAFSHPSFGFGIQSLTMTAAPAKTIYKSNYDNLVFDFTLKVSKPDTLKAITFKNLGDSTYLDNIYRMKLWADSGPAGFQGTDVDQVIGELAYLNNFDTWYLENLSFNISASQRFFVSVDSYAVMYKQATIQLQIPTYNDNNSDQAFNFGDQGIFMASGKNGPEDAPLTNKYAQTFSRLEKDILGPQIYFTNLFDKDTINSPDFDFHIFTREQGNHKVMDLKIFINGTEYPITRFTDNNHWIFTWEDIVDDDYVIYLEASDSWQNITKSTPINVKVRKAFVSIDFSSALIDKETIISDGLDAGTVRITLNNYYNKPVADREVTLDVSKDLMISKFTGKTDKAGKLSFEVRSTKTGLHHLDVRVDKQIFKTFIIHTITQDMYSNNLNFGDLIKGSNHAVYYLGADARRYVFPSENIYLSWYSDFKTVKVIPDQVLAKFPIGGNVTYKPGYKLIKAQSDSMVYAVDKGGVLRWIVNEEVAEALYGQGWQKFVVDVSDAFWSDYTKGTSISQWKDFDLINLKNTVTNINIDKSLLD